MCQRLRWLLRRGGWQRSRYTRPSFFLKIEEIEIERRRRVVLLPLRRLKAEQKLLRYRFRSFRTFLFLDERLAVVHAQAATIYVTIR